MQIRDGAWSSAERSGWVGGGHRGGSLACSQEEAGVLGDNVQGQGGEGVGPGHARRVGFIGCAVVMSVRGWKPW